MFKSYIPQLFLSLKGYNRSKFFNDISAGIKVGIIALPLSIAFSIASGAGPETGLITAIFAGLVAAIFGGSKVQISGPTGAFAVVLVNIIAVYGYQGLLMATFMAGILTTIFGLLKFGRFVKYIPLAVVIGFTAGIAATLTIGQLNYFFGTGLSGLPTQSFNKFIAVISGIKNINFMTVSLGIISILIMVLLPKISKKLPAGLIAIIICTGLNFIFKSTTLGDYYGIIKINIQPSTDFINFALIKELIRPAVTIAFLASVVSLLSAVVGDNMHKSKHNPDMELVGQGLANIVTSIFGGLPVTGAIARTSDNINNNAKTPVAAIVHSLTVLLLALVFMPFAFYIPMTVFSGIIMVVCYKMLNIKGIQKIFKTTMIDFLLMAVTFILTLVFDLVVAILVCTAAAFLSAVYNKFKHNHEGNATVNEDTLNIEGVISYINCEKVFNKQCTKQLIILNLDNVKCMDANAIQKLIDYTLKNEIKQIIIKNQTLKKTLKKHDEIKKYIA